MKVLLHYEDCEDESKHKSLKITLPKSWKTGPVSQLVDQFVDVYNAKQEEDDNQLNVQDLHLAIKQKDDKEETSKLVPICSDAVVVEVLSDRQDVYLCHGASETLAQQAARLDDEAKHKQQQQSSNQKLVSCTHFGCNHRFPPGGPYPPEGCVYHRLPPVFHETAKYWACCPDKKAYDWEDFTAIPGCQTGICTEVKEEAQKQFLGGTDLRAAAGGDGPQLKSIDDFNKTQTAGGAAAAPVLERLESVLVQELKCMDAELYQQVVQGLEAQHTHKDMSSAQRLDVVAQELGKQLKKAFQNIAVEQQRIK